MVTDEVDFGTLTDMSRDIKLALPKSKKKEIKTKKNWADSVATYNDL